MDKKGLISQIIEENRFENRKRNEPDSCPLYKKNIKCHNMSKHDLICLLCACPYYKSDILEGGCRINSPYGKWFYHKKLPKGKIWDCSDCTIPHKEEFVKNYLEKLSLEQLKELRKIRTVKGLQDFYKRM